MSVIPSTFSASKVTRRISAVARPITLAAIIVWTISPAHAANTVWFGGTGNWEVTGNWSAGEPTATDVAFINAGTATLSSNPTILGLSLNGGTLAGAGNLTLTGA